MASNYARPGAGTEQCLHFLLLRQERGGTGHLGLYQDQLAKVQRHGTPPSAHLWAAYGATEGWC